MYIRQHQDDSSIKYINQAHNPSNNFKLTMQVDRAQDEVQLVLESCILSNTKTKHINQAILYLKFAMKCHFSEDKKCLDSDFFVDGIVEDMKRAKEQDDLQTSENGRKITLFQETHVESF